MRARLSWATALEKSGKRSGREGMRPPVLIYSYSLVTTRILYSTTVRTRTVCGDDERGVAGGGWWVPAGARRNEQQQREAGGREQVAEVRDLRTHTTLRGLRSTVERTASRERRVSE